MRDGRDVDAHQVDVCPSSCPLAIDGAATPSAPVLTVPDMPAPSAAAERAFAAAPAACVCPFAIVAGLAAGGNGGGGGGAAGADCDGIRKPMSTSTRRSHRNASPW